MKQIPILLILLFAILGSCKPDEKDELEGKWKLKEIIDAEGNVSPVDTVWYNVMNTLFMYQLYDASQGESGKYRYEYGYKNWVTTDSVRFRLWSTSILKHTDWTEPARTFRVNEVSRSTMTLSSGNKTYKFTKF